MISKETTFRVESMEILDNSMVKIAAFDLPQDESYDPDFLYIKVRAVSAGEYYGDNKNGDWFAADELKRTFTTFLTAHVFKNHENKDAANAIGAVLSAVWDDAMKCVVLILKIDRKIAPTIVRAIEKGYMTDVSMGCRVPYSICSICGNKARNPREYCEHIRIYKRRIFPDGRKAFEINVNPKFHDISVVLNGAEKVAKITDIYDAKSSKKSKGKEVSSIKKVASVIESSFDSGMEKAASYDKVLADSFEMPKSDFMLKAAETEKRAEFNKRINGLILSSAQKSIENQRGLDSARLILKSAFTRYWTDSEIAYNALKLKAIAAQQGKSKQSVFASFLAALDFAGIELSPKELCGIASKLFNENIMPASEAANPIISIKKIEAIKDPISDMSITQAFPLKRFDDSGINEMSMRPVIKADLDGPVSDMIMKSIVKPMIPIRSVHAEPLVRRIMIIKKPFDSTGQFDVSSMMKKLYAMYQGDRVRRLLSGVFGGVSKTAGTSADGLFEKTARYTRIKAATLGTPIIYGYSKMQRSRMNNDKEVSTLNRFAAEYPEAIAGMNILFGPEIAKHGRKAIKAINKAGGIKEFAKLKMSKSASAQDDILYLYDNGYDDEANQILNKFAMDKSDLEDLLAIRVCEKSDELMAEAEKVASDMSNGHFNNDFDDDFICNVAIAKLIKEKCKN